MNAFAVLKRADGSGACIPSEVLHRKLSESHNIGWDVITPWLDGTILPGVSPSSPILLSTRRSGRSSIPPNAGSPWPIGFEGREKDLPKYPSDENGLGPVGRALRPKILAVQEGREEYQGWAVVYE